jgi:hypothetical protein
VRYCLEGVSNTVKLEDFENLTDLELRQKAMECFEGADSMQTLVGSTLLREAKFYLDEIERRNDAFRSRRDFWLEIIIISLIIIEIAFSYVSFRETPKEIAALETTAQNLQELDQVTKQQLAVYRDIAIDVFWDTSSQLMNVTNYGNTTVDIFGLRFGSGKKMMIPQPFVLVSKATLPLGTQSIYTDARKSLPKGETQSVALQIYITDTAGRRFTVYVHFFFFWNSGVLKVASHLDSIMEKDWTKDQ